MQQGGSQYGMSPEMTTTTTTTTTPFSATGGTSRTHMVGKAAVVAEAASPISSRAPAGVGRLSAGNLDELVGVSGGFGEDDGIGGEELERGVSGGGNRWPRQETIALLKIRSEMDAAFRDATLKGPLWDEVSRKLGELGYSRSAKKCKEKFENVHKYYKRTKEGRAGRQDGKSYRFFSQLEALHSTTNAVTPANTTATTTTSTPNPTAATPVSMGIGMVGSSGRIQPSSDSTTPTAAAAANPQIGLPQMNPPDLRGEIQTGLSGSAATATATAAGMGFSSNTSSDFSDSDNDDEDLEEGPSNTDSRKRKRGPGGGGSSSRKMVAFFEGLMKQVMERQEAMQQRFLETIEKRDQDRMIREEAWKRQEMARLTREHEIMLQERDMKASRDAAIIAFLQKITGQSIQLPPPVVIPATPTPQSTPPTAPPQPPQHQHYQHHQQQQAPPPPPLPQQQHQQKQQRPPQTQNTEIIRHQAVSSELVVAAVPEQQHPPQEMGGGGSLDPSSSRWPKAEVLALINLRSGLDSRYQEAGPKGPLWEEISAGMQRMGYNRSAKRCKEKWENINKYFKKVKESNKKRPEDAKTCPYFHQLDALYRKKMLVSGSGSSSSFVNQNKQEQQLESSTMDPNPTEKLQAIMPPPPPPQTTEAENSTNNNKNGGNMDVMKTSNESFLEEGNNGSGGGGTSAGVKKPEDIMMELIEHHPQHSVMEDYDKLEEPNSGNLDQVEEEEEEEELVEDEDDGDSEETEEEERKMAYKIQFQRPNAGSSNGGGNTAGSPFMAMVQ